MFLKSVNKSVNSANSKTSSFISRQSGGLCFDFHPKDSNNYLVGTEDGYIHRCSSSYNEQYLDSYGGHTGPIYKVKWSPFLNHVFLSCSADWTVRLWNQEEEQDIFKFQNGKVRCFLKNNANRMPLRTLLGHPDLQQHLDVYQRMVA